MATQSVKIPVELEVQMREMNSQIDKIRQLIGKIDPNTKGFQKLENQLKGIEREFQNIKKRAGETFTTQGQINTFSRKFEHLQTMTEDFGDSLKKIKFSAFKEDIFDQGILDNIKNTKDEIGNLEKEITKLGKDAFVKTAKSSQDLLDVLKELGINSVDELVEEEKILDSFSKIKESSKALKKELDDLDSKKSSKSNQKDKEVLTLEKKEFDLTTAIQDYAKLQSATEAARKELEKFQNVQQNTNTQTKRKSLSDTEAIIKRFGIERANFRTKAGRIQNGKDYFGDKGDKLDKDKLLKHLINDLSFTQKDLDRAGALSLTEQSLDAFYQNLAGLLKEKKESFEREIAEINKDVTEAQAALKKAEGAESTGKNKVEAAQAQFNKQKQIVDSLSKEITDLERRANEAQAKIDRNTAATAALEKAGKDKNTALEVAPQTQQVKDLEKKIQELEEALRASSQTAQQLQKEIEELGQGARKTGTQTGVMTNELDRVNEASRQFANIQEAVKRWFGFNEVINVTKRVVRDAITEIKELDSVMTEIAVVTEMSQKDLWAQIGTYSAVAQQYGVSTKGAYEVSMLWYQQGLQGEQVMELTIETLKMAKIAGLDYATATDYMTVALRGFKMEMEDAQRVTDVYSALAAATASDTEEIAVAMSKTASSAEAVGASMESTAAMIATMISVTREAPENIGSALKSIISRYGEMTTDPTKLVDSEGEVLSLNKVDKALKSVGISLQDANGKFRNFDDVILELAESWNTIDVNTQRYIATVMAGNRQQSRFLALVGNIDEYKAALETASDAEGAGTIQYLKTIDSIETKIQQVKTAWEQFYSSMGIENLFKGVLSTITKILTNLNKLSKGQSFMTLINVFKTLRNLIKIVFGDALKQIFNFFGQFKKNSELQLKIDTTSVFKKLEEIFARIRKGEVLNIKPQVAKENAANIMTTASHKVDSSSFYNTLGLFQAYVNKDNRSQRKKQNILTNDKDLNAFLDSVIAQKSRGIKNKNRETTEAIKAEAIAEVDNFKNALKQSGISFRNNEKIVAKASRAIDRLGQEANEASEDLSKRQQKTAQLLNISGQLLSTAGAALSTAALTINDSSEHAVERSKVASGAGGILSGIGTGLSTGMMVVGPWGAVIGAIVGLISAIPGIKTLVDGLNKTTAERIAQLEQEQQELDDEATKKKGEYSSFKSEIDNLKQLEKAQYDSEEAMQAYKDKMNELGDKYPELIDSYDFQGNAILELAKAEEALAEMRYESAKAASEAALGEYKINIEQAEKNKEALDKIENGDFYYHEAFRNEKQKEEFQAIGLNLYYDDYYGSPHLKFGEIQNREQLDVVLEYSKKTNKAGSSIPEYFKEIAEETGVSVKDMTGYDYDELVKVYDLAVEGDEISTDTLLGILSGGYRKNLEGDYKFQSAKRDKTAKTAIIKDVEAAFEEEFYLSGNTEEKITQNSGLWNTFGATKLEQAAIDLGYDSAIDMKITSPAAYYTEQEKIIQEILGITEDLTDYQVENLSKIYGSWDSYKNQEEAATALLTAGIEEDSELYSFIIDEYETKDKKASERIKKYADKFYSGASTRMQEKQGPFSYEHEGFYTLFDGTGEDELISAYADNVIEVMKEITSYVEKGLDSQAKTLEEVSFSFYNKISSLSSETQADLLSIVSSIDWNDQASILKASYEIDDYIKEHGDDLSAKEIETLNLVMEDLDTAYEDLTFNIATRIQNFNNALTENAEKVGSFLEKAAEGLDLTEAMNAFDSIAATNKDLTFNDVFVYDKELKKWVYTNEGLNKALEKQNEDLKIARQVRDDALEDMNRFDVNSAYNETGEIGERSIVSNKTTFTSKSGGEFSIWDSDFIRENEETGAKELVDVYTKDGKLTQKFYDKMEGFTQEEIAQMEQIILDYDPSSGIGFADYIAQYYEDLDKALLDSEQLYLGFLQEKRNQWLGALGLERLGAGATSGQTDNLRQGITDILSAQGDDLDKVIDGKNIIQYYTDEILSGNLAAMEEVFGEMSYEDKTSYLTGRTTAFTTAIDELFSTPGKVLSDTTIGLIEANGLGEILLNDSGIALNADAHTLLFTAVAFYHNLVDSFEQGYADIESVNAAAVSLLSGGLGIDKDAALEAVASNSSLSLDSLATLGNQFGFLLSDIISLEANSFGEGIGNFKDLIDYNEFTQTFDITGSFEDFISAIETVTGEYIDRTSVEYLQWYSDFVDSQVEKSVSYYENIADEIGNLEEAGIGDSINFTYLGDALGQDAEAIFEEFGIEFNDGLATITEEADLAGFFNLLMNSEEFQDKLGDSFDEVQDSIISVINHWSDLIVDAFSGTLSFGDAEILKGQLGLSDADFTETQEGLQLTYEGAVKLHSKIQDIHGMPKVKLLEGLAEGFAEMDDKLSDGISTYKELKRIEEDILELGENGLNPQEKERLKDLREEKALVEDILAIRSTEASFNFMDQELPEYLQAPMSLWEGAAQAFSVIQENGGSLFSGTMGLQDFTNIITAMENFGVDFYATAKDSSGKIYQGADLLSQAYKYVKYVDGEAVIDLSEFGQNFIVGGDDAQQGLASGIQELANFQIEMLNVAIKVLETIVAFEELGKVDIDNDGLIEMPELFKEGTFEKTDKHDEFLDGLIKRAEENEDFADALRSIQIGDKTLYDLFSEVSTTEEDLTAILEDYGLNEEKYTDLLNSFYQASLSGDFDPETFVSFLPEELQELFAGSGLTFKIGEQEITFASDGTVYTFESEEDKKETTDFLKTIYGSEEYDYANLTHDQTVLVQSQENITVEETGNIVYTTSTGQKINLGSDPVSAATQVEEIKKMDSSGITEVVAETFTDEHGTETTVITGKHTNLKIGQDYTVTSTITPAGKVATVVGRTPSGETITGEGTTVEEAQANWVAQAVEKGEFNNTTEAYAHIGITINSTPELKLNLSQLSGEELSRIAQAYYSGDRELFAEVGFELGLFAEKPTFENEEELNTWVSENLPELSENRVPLNMVISFGDMTAENAGNYSTAFESIATNLSTISGLSLDSATSFVDSFETVTDTTVTNLESIKTLLTELSEAGYEIDLTYNITGSTDQEGTYNVSIEDDGASTAIATLATSLATLSSTASSLATEIDNIEDRSIEVGNTADAISRLKDKSSEVGNTAAAIERLRSKNITASIVVKVTAPNPQPGSKTTSTIALSHAKGNVALAKGGAGSNKTLMGELGPELVVSNGHYFIVGNNGAEFVDLPSDAIVFNHLQTKKLLGAGGTVGTGEPITNERNAVAFASGNVTGPAKASASDTLSELYRIRALWQSLVDASAKDLATKAGSGGGGGGGGGGSDAENNKAYIHDLERWYNLMRQIAKLEQQVTLEQAKRENMRNGYDINRSLEKELALLRKQRDVQAELAAGQKEYYEQRRKDLNSTDYSKIFTYDSEGLMQYVSGENRGLDLLASINATDANGKALMTAKEQLAYLEKAGFDTSVLKTNPDGTEAETPEDQMQNFWDGVDGWMEEMDSLYDSYHEAATSMEEATTAMNEILQQQIDNQLSVEEKLLKAIEDREQAEIDRIQDEKDSLEAASQEYIDGLNQALERERSMYQKNETNVETARLQRQLAILQRSGGSASEIKSLQDQINSRLQDAYFQEQQDQINAIQEASTNQLEKLQTQIDIMTESLEYQKENGLLWNEVYTMMQTWAPEAMLEFIEKYTIDYMTNSQTQNDENSAETLKEIQQWVSYNTGKKQDEKIESSWESYYNTFSDFTEKQKEEHKIGAKEAFRQKYIETNGDIGSAERAATEYYQNKINNNKATNKENENIEKVQVSEQNQTGNGKVKTSTGERLNIRSQPNTNSKILGKLINGDSVALTGYSNGWYQIKHKGGKAYVWAKSIQTSDKNKLPAFSNGGLVDFTGPAWVDGSKAKPEAFLSAEDTAMLKSRIFSNSDGSLKALVAALEAITSDTSKYSANTSTDSIIIQNAQVNIQPGTISNDYDARRAGEMALEEMVKIARKTTNRVVSR